MKLKKAAAALTAIALLLSSSGVSAFAAETAKNTAELEAETVYVIADANGASSKILVSDQFTDATKVDPKSLLSDFSDVQNVKGDNYWQSTSEKELPVEIAVTYMLNGKTVTPSEIAGKSGKVTIRFDYKNNQIETLKSDGETKEMYVPFVCLTGLILDNDHFRNIRVTNGKTVDDGDKTIIAGIALPGMQENLGLEKDTLEIPSYVEIQADASDFALETTVTLISNSLFSQIDEKDIEGSELGSIGDDLAKLTSAMNSLISGSEQLSAGLTSLSGGASTLASGMKSLSNGLNTLDSNSSALNSGAEQVFSSLLSAANSQIAASGLEVTPLTVSNYETVLTALLEQLDSAGTAAETAARQQVEAAVRAQSDAVRTAVTAAVQDTVAQSVTEAVQAAVWSGVLESQGLTAETYAAGVEAGMIDETQQAALAAALDSQMQSETVQAQIAASVSAQMATDDVQALIASNTESQIQLLIEQQMASDEVQGKIMAVTSQASAGAVSIRALKQQLESYQAFYDGLRSYTAGVHSAAVGAAKINANIPALTEGVAKLESGSKQLEEGLKQFNEEGIQKLVSLFSDDLEGLSDRIGDMTELSRSYKSYSGIAANECDLQFIVRTESVKG